MFKITLSIDGMACGMCEAHICDVIRRTIPDAEKVTASRTKKEASFISENIPSEDTLKKAIADTGYTCNNVQSKLFVKKSIFSKK